MTKKTVTFEYWSFDYEKGWEKEPPANQLILVNEEGCDFWYYARYIKSGAEGFYTAPMGYEVDGCNKVNAQYCEEIIHWAFPPSVPPNDNENE